MPHPNASAFPDAGRLTAGRVVPEDRFLQSACAPGPAVRTPQQHKALQEALAAEQRLWTASADERYGLEEGVVDPIEGLLSQIHPDDLHGLALAFEKRMETAVDDPLLGLLQFAHREASNQIRKRLYSGKPGTGLPSRGHLVFRVEDVVAMRGRGELTVRKRCLS